MSKSGAFFSQKPLTLTMAKRQQRALYAKEKRGEMYEGGSYTYMTHNGQPHLILRGEGFFGDLFAKVKTVASNVANSIGRVATNVLHTAMELCPNFSFVVSLLWVSLTKHSTLFH